MKIQINLNDGLGLKGQMEAVSNYIFSNICQDTNSKEKIKVSLQTTPKGEGQKIKTSFGKYHISCHKTKIETFKFKVWPAV